MGALSDNETIKYKESIFKNSRSISGYKIFINILNNKIKRIAKFEKLALQLEYIEALHKSLYEFVPYAHSQVQEFEVQNCCKVIEDIDKLLEKYNSTQQNELCKELGKLLNKLTREYNNTLLNVKEIKKGIVESGFNAKNVPNTATQIIQVKPQSIITNNKNTVKSKKLPAILKSDNTPITNGLKFTVNPIEQRFIKSDYMLNIESDPKNIHKTFEQSLPWAVSQFPDRILRDKIRICIKYHKSLLSFIDYKYDEIMRFENLIASQYLEIVSNLVTIPQALADTQEKFLETARNLNIATDKFQEALKALLDKFMESVDIENRAQLDTFKNIVDNIL